MSFSQISIRIDGETEIIFGLAAQRLMENVNKSILNSVTRRRKNPFSSFKWSPDSHADKDQIQLVYEDGKEQYLHGSDARKWSENVKSFVGYDVVHRLN